MTTLRTLCAGLLAALGLVALTPTTAHACSCALSSTEQHLRGADVVFTGTLTDVVPPLLRPVMSSDDPATYRFDVHRVLKGDVHGTTDVQSAVSGASCGLEGMTVDQEYVVFATGHDELSANLCGGTAPARPAMVERVARLAHPARSPAVGTPAADATSGSAATWAVVGVAGLLAAIAAGLALRRR
jgi:hypothetical protein